MNQLALIAKTQALIAAGDISGAEAALSELADAEGDGALLVVLEQLPPKDVLAVMREYDDSKGSIINMMVTPAQFAHAVVIEKQYKDLTRSHLRGMMNSVIFRDNGAQAVEFLTAIGDLEGGSEALADYFTERWSRIEAFARSGDDEADTDDEDADKPEGEDGEPEDADEREAREHEAAGQAWMESQGFDRKE